MRNKITELLNAQDADFLEELMSGYLYGEKVLGDFKLELMKDYGGEDQGSDYWAVWKFTLQDEVAERVEYVKFYGYYQSYNGADYQGWEFVTPKQVMVTEWY